MPFKKNIKEYTINDFITAVTDDVTDIEDEEDEEDIKLYNSEYKLNILKEVETLSDMGELGELLCREGLSSSHLATWFWQRERGELAGLCRNKNIDKDNIQHILTKKIDDLEGDFYAEIEKTKRTLEERIAILEEENKELKKILVEAKLIINNQK